MSTNLNHIDDLIGKYLAGEASVEETAFVESWVKADEQNKKYLDQLRTIFTKAAAVKEIQTYDTDAAWKKLKSSMKDGAKVRTLSAQPNPFFMSRAWRVAASVLVILGVGLFAYRMLNPSTVPPLEVATNKTTEADTLPDGSDVFLNRETKLTYSYDKKKKVHLVKLKGEAYFNIQHEDNKTFLVQISDIFIRDIGTAFNVKAYPDSDIIEVVVEQGEVMFYSEKDSGVYLRANGKGIYNKKTKTFTIDQPEANVLSYKTKFFSFSNTDLKSVVEALNDVYDKKIVLRGNVAKCRLTVSFNNESLEQIVEVMKETLNLTVTDSGGQIVLEGTGCVAP
ncbi:FecR family protein [Chryseolinea lacunae]|uniref:FecR domain-containing protein n=1 Tax=Chryseolinea lacunae TaxID=2801331 RepID=A0ABS1KYJ0_9BACT|nr:FecR domain-containing protein [Chryseolinea lacunae]MBL0743406.1 FecR domain-containing protein [Chryseolinea lacunae]